MRKLLTFGIALICVSSIALGQGRKKTAKTEKEEQPAFNSADFSGLKFRNIGPALTSGRIADFAVREDKPSEYYVAVASGGVWKR
jgi:hypothetical protein